MSRRFRENRWVVRQLRFPFLGMLARVLACPLLRYPLTIDHLKEAPLGFARG